MNGYFLVGYDGVIFSVCLKFPPSDPACVVHAGAGCGCSAFYQFALLISIKIGWKLIYHMWIDKFFKEEGNGYVSI